MKNYIVSLSKRPNVLLFDEPTSALDPELVRGQIPPMHAVAAQREVQLFVGGIAFLADEMQKRLDADGRQQSVSRHCG